MNNLTTLKNYLEKRKKTIPVFGNNGLTKQTKMKQVENKDDSKTSKQNSVFSKLVATKPTHTNAEKSAVSSETNQNLTTFKPIAPKQTFKTSEKTAPAQVKQKLFIVKKKIVTKEQFEPNNNLKTKKVLKSEVSKTPTFKSKTNLSKVVHDLDKFYSDDDEEDDEDEETDDSFIEKDENQADYDEEFKLSEDDSSETSEEGVVEDLEDEVEKVNVTNLPERSAKPMVVRENGVLCFKYKDGRKVIAPEDFVTDNSHSVSTDSEEERIIEEDKMIIKKNKKK